MEHNFIQLMQFIQFWAIFECTLILHLCTFLHQMVLVLRLHYKVTWVPELSIRLIEVAVKLNHLLY